MEFRCTDNVSCGIMRPKENLSSGSDRTMTEKQSENLEERKKRVGKMVEVLKKLYPEVRIALNYGNNWELVVAVVLSAQSTDKKINEVTATLFKKYQTLNDYANADIRQFEQDIKASGFYRNKARNILASAKIIKERFGGTVPDEMEDLLTLPGVARKTANIVLGNAYGIVEGIAVDTHVRRFALKFDLTENTEPNKIEQDLMNLLPKKEWFDFTYRLQAYGREICPARKHDCRNHPLTKIYPPAADRWPGAR
jgi:endonuclease-3